MDTHNAQGVPYSPEDQLATFSARFEAAEALAECLIREGKIDDRHGQRIAFGLAEVVRILGEDLREVTREVGEWQLAHRRCSPEVVK